jgi:GntR family transcriptional regulator of arabinose operon
MVQPEEGKMDESPRSLPKYRQILDDLKKEIETGGLRPGDKLPTEAKLGERYQASRITVAKAVNELVQQGLVSRRAGSGTHVLGGTDPSGHVFGLLIPDLGRTEIFEPICQGMMASPLAKPHSLLWGHAMGEADLQAEDALRLCHHYIQKKVSGVFFAPLEFSPSKDHANQAIASALERAGIPIVLLDRCYAPYPLRSQHDLVGIDNRAAGYMITAHLLDLGMKRPVFVSRALSASTVFGRISGYREALRCRGVAIQEDLVRVGDTADPDFVKWVLDNLRPDSFVCANDLTAGRLISTLASLGISVPDQMRVVGVDVVKYAALFSVPLTTQHQNCYELGAMAIATMLQRLADPSLPVRDILLQTATIVRESCGAKMQEQRAAREKLAIVRRKA